jgi:hypothetical protein
MIDPKKPPAAPAAPTTRRHRISEKTDEKAFGGVIGETDRHQRQPRDKMENEPAYDKSKLRRIAAD